MRRTALLLASTALALLFSCAVVLFGVEEPAEAAFPGTNGKIAFVKGSAIYAMNSDGSNAASLTQNGDDMSPE